MQVAGHENTILNSISNTEILKPHSEQEHLFYTTHSLPWLPSYKGLVKREETDYLSLENLRFPFKNESVMDLKLGKILCGPGTSDEKNERMLRRAEETTSLVMGIRICGMDVKGTMYGKEFGTDRTRFLDGLNVFFGAAIKVVQEVIEKVRNIREGYSKLKIRCFSASLLILHDGSGRCDVRMIDFCHYFSDVEGCDLNVCEGMDRFIEELEIYSKRASS